MPEKEYLTVAEAVALLGISKPTIYKMIREGKIRALNTGQKYLIESRSLNANPIRRWGEQRKEF